jgi:predicted ATPase/DNA-binding XRE family transcriptional regulator
MLRRYRLYAGFSQEELADRARLSARAISDLERGVKQTPHRETVELLADALGLSGQRRALFSASVRPARRSGGEATLLRHVRGDMAAPLTPLIGRERELLELVRLMANGGARLVTLTGPGGVGKTRVALRAAEELAGEFDDGALIVSLSSLVDAGLVLPTVAHGLGLGEEASKASIDQLASHLGQQHLLLVLDNMEHLLDAASDVAALLAVCPRLSVIVTSRQPLRIRGEREFGISPLAPDAAAQLFLDRVRDNGSYGDADADVTEIVAHICHQLDYLPLALELAAVRSRTLSLHALALRLGSSLSLLTLGLRDLPERQRTLRGAIAWSVDLLDERERRLFRRLATFHGGWSLDAAHLVCSQAPDAPEDTLDRLSSLVERNLVLVNSSAQGEFRFSMLRTIWEYADEALRLTGEAAEVRERHAAYFAAVAEDEGDVSDLDAHDRLIQLDADNMRAALRWAVETRHAPLAVRLGVGLARYWYMRGYGHEGERWIRNVLALDESAEPRADPQLRIAALYAATRFAMDRRDYDGAERMAREGLALADEARSAVGKANMLATLGHVAEARMNYEEAYGLFERSLQWGRQANDLPVIGRAVSSLGNLARAMADYAQARTFLEEAVAVARTMKMSWGIANGLTSLGHVTCEQGEFVSASALYRESLGIYADLANEASVAWTLEGVIVVHAAAGAHMQVATLAGVINTLRCDASGTSWAPFSAALDAAQSALGPSLWREAFAAGAAMDIAAATTYAMASLT